MLPNQRRAALITIALAGLAFDFLLPFFVIAIVKSTQSTMLVSFMTGTLAAHIGILAIWSAMANQAIEIRVPVALGLFVCGACLFLLGLRVSAPGPGPRIQDVVVMIVLGLIMFLAVQTPLWCIRLFARRSIGVPGNDQAKPVHVQISIRYLLVVTAVAAASIALVQAALPPGRFGGTLSLWGFIMTVTGMAVTVSVTVPVPCIWLVLSESDSGRAFSAVGMFVAWGVGPFVIWMLLAALSNSNASGDVVMEFYAFSAGVCGSMVLSLLVLRAIGYRLLRQSPAGDLVVVGD